MYKRLTSLAAILAVAAVTVVADDVQLDGIKCVISPKAADAAASADYKDGKVYFCCGGCAGTFKDNQKKFTVKANHQLVATKQYKQTKCPISGRDVNPETVVKIAGTEVLFCCSGCKSKVANATDDKEKMKIVFNDKAFAKSFSKVEKPDTK